MGTKSTPAATSAAIDRDLVIEFRDSAGTVLHAKPVMFRAAVSRGKNTFWGVLGQDEEGKRIWRRQGWKLDAAYFGIADPTVLPATATITDPETGESVEVKFDSTDATGEPLLRENGQPYVSASRQNVALPGVCADRVFEGTLSLTKDGTWNTNISAHTKSGGGSGPKALGEEL